MESRFDRQNNGINYGEGRQRSGNCWEISKRAKPKSSQRPSGSKKIVLKTEKVFQARENITNIRDEFSGCDIDGNCWPLEGYMYSLCVNTFIQCSIKRNTLIAICFLIGPAETRWQDK